MYQELYHMLHLAQNFDFAPFFWIKNSLKRLVIQNIFVPLCSEQ